MFQFTSFPSTELWIHSAIHMHYHVWVPPFGHLRVNGYVLLTAAFRSLSRPSSAPSAKASTRCSLYLTLPNVRSLGLPFTIVISVNFSGFSQQINF